MEPLLRCDQVEISYHGRPIVQDISFPLLPGEILGIVGESGSGKSTLLKGILGLLGPGGAVTKGSIWYKNKNLPNLPPKELRKLCGKELGMVFQDSGSAFCPVRTIDAQIYECMAAHGSYTKTEAMERGVGQMEKLGLPNPRQLLSRYPFELSGGMVQRAGICIAMLHHPSILLADEPTSALDAFIQRQVIDEMLLMRKLYHISIILVTHHIGVVRAMADRILVLKDGHIVESGDTSEVLEHPASSYTKLLMASVPHLRRKSDEASPGSTKSDKNIFL